MRNGATIVLANNQIHGGIVNLSDSGTGTEVLSISVSLPLKESSSGTENTFFSISLAPSDSGIGSDGVSVTSPGDIFLGDMGIGNDLSIFVSRYSVPIDIYIDKIQFNGGFFVNLCRGLAPGPAPGYLSFSPGLLIVQIRWSDSDIIFVPPYTQATLFIGGTSVELTYLNNGNFSGLLPQILEGNILIWVEIRTGGASTSHQSFEYAVYNGKSPGP